MKNIKIKLLPIIQFSKLICIFLLFSIKGESQIQVGSYWTTVGVTQYPTHIDSLGKGGYRVVKDITQRNAITCLRRKFGMAVYVQSESKLYILKDSACNNVWEEFTAGGGGGGVDSVGDFGSFYSIDAQYSYDDTSLVYGIQLSNTDTAKGFYISTNSIVCNKKGLYNLQFNGQLYNNGADGIVTIWLKKNDVNIPYSSRVINVPAEDVNNSQSIASLSYILPLDKNDFINFYVKYSSYGIRFEPSNAYGSLPSRPSIVANVIPLISGSTNAIDSIRRKVASDSVFGYINGVKIFQFKDSSGGAGTITKAVDSVYKVNNGDTIFVRYNNNTVISTLKIKDSIGITDTANKYVNAIGKNTTRDSIIFFIGTKRYAIRDSIGGSTIDTTSLSNRINQKLNISDTSNMLSGYVRKSRTISTTSPLTGGGSLNGDLTLSIPPATISQAGYMTQAAFGSLVSKADNSIQINAKLGTGSNLSGGGDLQSSRTIIIPKATTSVDGYLSALDYISFSGKQNALTPISPIEISGSNLSIRKAGLSDSGYLSSVDWNTFNNKLNASDTTNKFVNNVIKLNDSTISVYKGTGFTNITLTPSTTVANASRLVTTVYNNSGSTITKGSLVYINGRHSSNYATIALAQANDEANSYSTFAMVQDDILNNNTGTVIQAGNISNLNLPTATYTDGQVIYLSPTVAGGITTTKPLAPNHIVKIGTVTRAHPTLGSIELKIENGWQLDELSDVQIAAVPADSTILQFSRVDSLWHDVNPTTAMGNRFVRNISRVPGKDSIIFTIGTTRYAIKDSVGDGGGGAAGPEYSVQYKNADGNMSGDANLTWIYQSKLLGIGTDNPSTTLDVRKGVLDDLPRNYEIANFSQNGDTKIGIYNSGNYTSGGASMMLGHTKNQNSNAGYPGFEIQNGNDSANASGFIRFNYVEKGTDGYIANASTDLLTINSNGIVQINPTDYGVAVNPRLVVGVDNYGEAQLEVTGASMLNGKLTTTGARVKPIVYLSSEDATTYSVTSTDHIIIYNTVADNCTVNLPASPENGRELTIKQIGDYTTYTITVDAGSGKEISDIGGQSGSISSTINSQSITLVYYSGIWYLTAGQIE